MSFSSASFVRPSWAARCNPFRIVIFVSISSSVIVYLLLHFQNDTSDRLDIDTNRFINWRQIFFLRSISFFSFLYKNAASFRTLLWWYFLWSYFLFAGMTLRNSASEIDKQESTREASSLYGSIHISLKYWFLLEFIEWMKKTQSRLFGESNSNKQRIKNT